MPTDEKAHWRPATGSAELDSARQNSQQEPLLNQQQSYHDEDDREVNVQVHQRPRRRVSRQWLNTLLVITTSLLAVVAVLFLGIFVGRSYFAIRDLSLSTPDAATLFPVKPYFATPPRHTIVLANGTIYARPKALRIIGVVFFGRRQFAQILECYLRRNLAVNGGILDEVQFIMHTQRAEDREWLENLVSDHHLEDHFILKYENTEDEEWDQWGTFDNIWASMTNPAWIYIKIDDDVIYMEDNAMNELVRMTIEHPEAYGVVPNIINNQFTYWYHSRGNAIYPYVPEITSTRRSAPSDWHPFALPSYDGPLPDSTIFSRHEEHDDQPEYAYPTLPRGHRWLPIRNLAQAAALAHTPFGNELPSANEPDRWHSAWTLAAQSHYSFFENVARGEMYKYHFGSRDEGLQNLWYSHYSINIFAIRGDKVALVPFWNKEAVPESEDHDDETMVTSIIPKNLSMPVLLASRAVANHFAYGYDRDGVKMTDVLDRYRLYANEMVCGVGYQKTAFRELPPKG